MGVMLSRSSATLSPGDSLVLTADVLPEDAGIKTIVWNSSNPAVAMVTNGIVTALEEGVTDITATTTSGNKSATCLLTVAFAVSGITIERAPIIMVAGRQLTLKAIITPDDAPDKTLTWSSSNPEVAAINDGVVTAIAPGTVTMTATTKVGGRTAKHEITVFPDNFSPINLSVRATFNSWFSFYGSDFMYVDWGDGSPYNGYDVTRQLNQCNHNYTDLVAPYTISILGENITRLNCCDINFSYYLNLVSLEISHKNPLAILYCANTYLSNLDVSGCEALNELDCSFNQLSRLDLSHNTSLQIVYCQSNQLSAEALNALFGTLHNQPVNKIIYIGDNPGTAACDLSIATGKGWIVF